MNEPLSHRELQVCDLVAEGMTNQQIAAVLHVSANTVKSHMLRIFRKTGVTSRAGLARHVLHPPAGGSVVQLVRTSAEVVRILQGVRAQRSRLRPRYGSINFYRQEGELFILDALIRQISAVRERV